MVEYITVKWYNQIDKKPEKCVRCNNTTLRSDVVEASIGQNHAGHRYCAKCKCLMVYPE